MINNVKAGYPMMINDVRDDSVLQAICKKPSMSSSLEVKDMRVLGTLPIKITPTNVSKMASS